VGLSLTQFEPMKLSRIIGEHEHKRNGLDYFPHSSVQVVNMRIDDDIVHADVLLQTEPGEPFEAYRDQEYPASFFYTHSTQEKDWFLGIENMTRDEFLRIFWKGKLIDCTASCESRELLAERATRLADACRTIERDGQAVTYLAVTKKLLELHTAALAEKPGVVAGADVSNLPGAASSGTPGQ